LFGFELGCGEMENITVTRSLRRQLDQGVLHEQVENGITISNNLSVDKVDQQFETPRKVSRLEHKHMWTKEKYAGHKRP
jgi:hypothetical protein